jgi:hypothetical protein
MALQDLVDHVMSHQQNKDELEQPPPLLASPAIEGTVRARQQSGIKENHEKNPLQGSSNEHYRSLIPSPPPLLQFSYQRPGVNHEDSKVNSTISRTMSKNNIANR